MLQMTMVNDYAAVFVFLCACAGIFVFVFLCECKFLFVYACACVVCACVACVLMLVYACFVSCTKVSGFECLYLLVSFSLSSF